MKKTLLILAALALSAGGCSRAGVTVDAPTDLKTGQTGTITVTVTNDNTATPARAVTLTATLFYLDLGVGKTLVTNPVSINVSATNGADWLSPRWQLAQTPGVIIDWNSIQFSGDAVGPYADSAHTVAAQSLAPGKSWVTTLKVSAP